MSTRARARSTGRPPSPAPASLRSRIRTDPVPPSSSTTISKSPAAIPSPTIRRNGPSIAAARSPRLPPAFPFPLACHRLCSRTGPTYGARRRVCALRRRGSGWRMRPASDLHAHRSVRRPEWGALALVRVGLDHLAGIRGRLDPALPRRAARRRGREHRASPRRAGALALRADRARRPARDRGRARRAAERT